VQQLRTLGFNASALEGGFNAWRAQYPVEPALKAAIISL
jgi:rhodanese-related sulfurtransferase